MHPQNTSSSTISSESSRASRKSLDISTKVMGFIHRRVNSVDAPAPLGVGHPAYDGNIKKPRVCLPSVEENHIDLEMPRSRLHDDSVLVPETIHENPSTNHINTGSEATAVQKHQETKAATTPASSLGLNAWLNLSSFIQASDRAMKEKAAIAAKETDTYANFEIFEKFIPQPDTNIAYGRGNSAGKPLPDPTPAKVTTIVAVAQPPKKVVENIRKTFKTTLQNSPNSVPGKFKDDIQPATSLQVSKEPTKKIPTAMDKSSSQSAQLCLNYIRGYPCYYGSDCDRYHDEDRRKAAMMHPCEEYNSGRLCGNRKTCTLYHDVVVHDKMRLEMTDRKVTTEIADPGKVSKYVTRCVDFALGNECPRKDKCTHYHDPVFGNSTRQVLEICKNFLVGLPCRFDVCRYRHDIELRDSLNRMCSHRSVPLMDGGGSDKTSTLGGDNHKHTPVKNANQKQTIAKVPITAGKARQLCCNFIFGISCNAGSNCTYEHNEELRARTGIKTCRSFAMGTTCPNKEKCTFYHDIKLREVLMSANSRKASAVAVSKVENKISPSQQNRATNKSTQSVEKKAMVPAMITEKNPLTNTIAAKNSMKTQDTTKTTRTVQKTGPSQIASSFATNNSTKPSLKRNFSAAAVTSSTLTATPKKLPLCPFFHSGKYTCLKGDNCDKVHNVELQQTYKSKDPQFHRKKPQVDLAKTSKWPKNSYDLGAWSLSIVPMVPPTKAEGEFTWFPYLPGEIRVKIWKFALCIPHSPIVHQHFRDERSRTPTAKYVSYSKLPPLLVTCRDSRAEALKYYSLCLGTVTSPPRTYLNYETSFVYLCTRRSGYFLPMIQCLLPKDLDNIQHLTLKLRDWLINEDCEFRDAIWKFPNLKTLQLLISSRDEDEEFRTPVAGDVLQSVLLWQAHDLNPTFKMPKINIIVFPGLEIDSDPEEYAPPLTRGERISDIIHERQIRALFSSAV